MDKIEEVLTRGVQEVLPSKKRLADLMAKKKITLYQGFDPTTKDLHLGHLIGARKLAQFQRLGHKVIFLIGDGTGQAGDPSGKTKTREKFMTKDELKENAKGYKEQLKNIIRFDGPNPVKILYNSKWLNDLKLVDILNISQHFSVQRLIERDIFKRRLKKGESINFREFLYPLLQGYDSVAMGVDLEIGGNDQLFNMMAGRMLMKTMKGKEKIVLTMKLLVDPTGKKMGKTEGNVINLTDSAENIFGKIMALPDSLLNAEVELLTDLPIDFSKDKNPLDAKKAVAFEVVKQVHGSDGANKARNHFEKTFQKREPNYTKSVPTGRNLVEVVGKTVGSKSEAKRLILQGGVDVDEKTVTDPTHKIKGEEKLKIGKKTFVRVKK